MKLLRTASVLLACLFQLNMSWAAPFTPGNVVVYRIGTGTGSLVSTGSPVFIDEYNPNGSPSLPLVPVQTLAMPTAQNGLNAPFAASGTATSDGLLTRSSNGECLMVPGYGRDPTITTGNLTSTAGIPRVAARLATDGSINTTTALTDAATGGNFRGATSDDCTRAWTTGSTGGVRAVAAIGATTSSDLTSGTFANSRAISIVGGQLYASASSGTNTFRGVETIGTGLPTSGAQPVTRLPGLTDALNPSSYAFFFADLSAGVAGVDTLYIADDGVGALSKFSFVSGSWVLNGTIGIASDVYRGITGVVINGVVTLYATRKGGSTATGGGELVKLTDTSGYNGAFAGSPTILATAAANTAFRGVALAPGKLTVTTLVGANGSMTPTAAQTVFYGETLSFTVSPDAGYVSFVGGTCGGVLVGNTYTTSPITSDCRVDAGFTSLPTYTVTPSANAGGSITPATPQTVQSGGTTSFTVTPSPGFSVTVGGTCGGSLVGNLYTTNAIAADCSVIATFTQINHVVTPSAGANGSIAPATPQSVAFGANTAFTVTPDAGYSASVGGTCGGTLVGNTFTTSAVVADCTVTATFVPLPSFTVTPSASANGNMTPNTPTAVVSGNTATFNVTPNAGYNVAIRGTCGGTLVGNTFTTKPIVANCTVTANFARKIVLFVGNSYTFGRIDPVMSYNTANVTDLTYEMWLANPTGSNVDEPHPWGGIPGVFKKMTDQAGLEFDVSISARNAASLRGHYLNSNPAGWDLRGNVASQRWDAVMLQDLSDEPLPAGRSPNANLPYFNTYADKFENWIHVGTAETFTETMLFGAGNEATCAAVTGASVASCNTVRTVAPANAHANVAASVYLYQTWARPDLIAPNGTNVGGTTYTAAEGLETMTADFHNAYFGRAAANPGFKGVSPVGNAFLRAVQAGIAMRDPYVPEAGKLNLWHTDYFHPSKYGSYLSALVHFAILTGIDPTTLGAGELSAIDLGIAAADAVALQQVAKDASFCQPGSYSATGLVPCQPASPGNLVATVGATSQTACNVGTFQPASGAIACLPAQPGNFVDVTGAVAQSACLAGTFQPASGAVLCLPAQPGNFVSVTGSAIQTACLVGTYQPASGAIACLPAQPGNFVDVAGSAAQTACFSGTYQPASGAITCIPAQPGFFVPTSGAISQTACPGGTTSLVSGATACVPISQVLTVSLAGTGTGSVTSTPAGIACPGTCSESFAGNTSVTLVATPNVGSQFSGWSGVSCSGGNSGASCTFTLSSNSTVTATFNPGLGATIARHDFNDDGRSDVLWRNAGTGQNYIWQVNGLTIASQGLLPGLGSEWSVAGLGDFNGDGKTDVLWRRASDGANYVWHLSGSFSGGIMTIVSQGLLPSLAPEWTVAGLSDFNGDGKSDILWRRLSDGANYVWHIDGTTINNGVLAIASQGLLPSLDPAWVVTWMGDFNGDGKADVFWRNGDANYVWQIDGSVINGGLLSISSQGLLPSLPAAWVAVGVGDYNGDGKADIFWRNADANYVWHVDGTVVNGGVLSIASQGLLPNLDTSWSVAGFGDYDGDGKADVFWRNAAGQNYLWFVNGAVITNGLLQIQNQGILPSLGSEWAVVNPK